MFNLSVLYVPVGRKTFDLETAEKHRQASSDFLRQLTNQLIHPDKVITSTDELNEFVQGIDKDNVDVTVYQSATFADGEFPKRLIEKVTAPVLVWSVREPAMGGRLRLNSLTGGNSTSHVLRCANHPYTFVFGNADEAHVRRKVKQMFNVQHVAQKLKQLKIGVIGAHPPGFYFSDTNEELLKKQLGVSVVQIELRRVFEESVKLPREQWEPALNRAAQQVVGLNASDKTVERFAQFYTYVKQLIAEQRLSALAIRCLPEFFTEFGAAACSTLSQFTEEGIVASCESDIHGSISMFILHHISGGKAPYLGDLVHVNEASNSAVFWHCGAGAYSLAHPRTGARAGVHPNRKVGFTLEFGLKPGKVTIFRLGYTPEGYRLLVMRGEALDTPQRFDGTSVEVKLETDVSRTLHELMALGFEPHYALVHGDVANELVELGTYLGIETTVFAGRD